MSKRIPNFIVAGAAKSGTTALCEYLASDPRIFMTKPKELDFFLRPRTSEEVEGYLNYFNEANDLFAGEGSVSYLSHSKHSAPQLKANFPDIKLVFMLRNPIDRYVSDFWYYIVRGLFTHKPNLFEDVLFKKVTLEIHKKKRDYREYLIERGCYAKNLKVFMEHFDSSQIHIIFFEDFIKKQKETIQELYDFFGIDYNLKEMVVEQSNKTVYPNRLMPIFVLWKSVKKYMPQKLVNNKEFKDKLLGIKALFFKEKRPPLSPKARQELVKIYKNSIVELEELLNKDLSHWKV